MIKRFCFFSLLSFLWLNAYALGPTVWNARFQAYVDRYKDVAIAEMLQWHIPASITLAQGLLESGAGESELSRKGNNHFGIKCHGWTGRTTYHDDDATQECFRAYDDVYDSYEDHSRFLATGQHYRKLFSLPVTDYKGWAHGLKECGYATNPRYAQLLIDIIECYHLYDFDRATSYDRSRLRSSGGHNVQSVPANRNTTVTPASHIIRYNNKRYYVIANEGDTYKMIAKEFDASYRKLASYNERSTKTVLRRGEIVYLQKKRTKAAKVYKNHPHIVARGESLYDISQMYGIRLSSLYKKNNLSIDYKVKVGDIIRIY